MALHTSLKELYEQRRYDNAVRLREHINAAYAACPDLKELDLTIKRITLTMGRNHILQKEQDKNDDFEQKKQLLIKKRVALLEQYHIPKDYDKPVYTCPLCQDEGHINGEACICFQQAKAELLFEHSPIRTQLVRENFSHFDLSRFSNTPVTGYGISPRENMQAAHTLAEEFCETFPNGRNLLITGTTGVGKTFLTNCIAERLLHAQHTVTYLTSAQFFQLLADHEFRKDTTEEAMERYRYMQNCELLIIDDLGTEMNNSFVETSLFECINQRILTNKSTIISTNLNMKQLEDNYTRRVSSRLIEHYETLPLFGPDLRLEKRKKMED